MTFHGLKSSIRIDSEPLRIVLVISKVPECILAELVAVEMRLLCLILLCFVAPDEHRIFRRAQNALKNSAAFQSRGFGSPHPLSSSRPSRFCPSHTKACNRLR